MDRLGREPDRHKWCGGFVPRRSRGLVRRGDRELNHPRLQGDFHVDLRHDRQSADFPIQLAGGQQHRIAIFFGGQSAGQEVRQQLVIGIDRRELLQIRVSGRFAGTRPIS